MRQLIPAMSLVELLVVISLVAVVSVPAFLTVGSLRTHQALASSAENLAFALKRAHIFAREGRFDTAWGVKYLDSQSYLLIRGSSDLWHPEGQYRLDSPVTFQDPFATVWFTRSVGQTDSTTLVLTTPTHKTAEITVESTGVVDVK